MHPKPLLFYMHIFRHKAFLFLCFFFLTIGTSLYGKEILVTETFGETNDSLLEISTPFSKFPVTGYLPITVEIENKTDKDRFWSLRFVSDNDSYRGASGGIRSSEQIECKAGSTALYKFLVPIAPGFHRSWLHQRQITVYGPGFEGSHSSDGNLDWTHVLISKSLQTVNGSQLTTELEKTVKSHRGSINSFGAQFEPSQLPDNWRAYIGYEVLMMTDKDWTSAPLGARNAIRQWVQMGGRFFFYKTLQTTNLNTLKFAKFPDRNEESIYGSGLINIQEIDASKLSLDIKQTVGDIKSKNYYRSLSQSLRDDFSSGAWKLQSTFGKRAFNIGIVVLCMLLFGVIVGPINLFVFAKEGKRHKLFITTPIISGIASLLFIGIIILQDGFGGRGMRQNIIEIGSGEDHNAYIHQEQISRTGVLLKSAFTVEEPIFLSPVCLAKSRWARFTNGNDSAENFKLQINDQDTLFSGDWFSSRSEHAHTLATVRPFRGGIDFKKTNSGYTATSSLNFKISKLLLRDDTENLFISENLNTGETVSLKKIGQGKFDAMIKSMSDEYSERNKKRLERLASRLGSFVALSENAEAIESLPSINWQSSKSIITGTLD